MVGIELPFKKLRISTDKLIFGMVYGSKNPETDIDIFLTYSESKPQKSISFEKYDISQVEINDLIFRLNNLDPEYTEPLLTGTRFFGDQQIINNIRNLINNTKLNESSSDYLKKRGLETFLQSKILYSKGLYDSFKNLANISDYETIKKDIFEKNKYSSNTLSKSLSNLSYSYSYLAFEKRYSKNNKTPILSNLLLNPIGKLEEKFSDLMNYYKNNSNSEINIEKTEDYFQFIEEQLRKANLY
jgi:hypothetical protein